MVEAWLLVASPASKVRFRGEAEVGREARPADSVENDPHRTLTVSVEMVGCERLAWSPSVERR